MLLHELKTLYICVNGQDRSKSEAKKNPYAIELIGGIKILEALLDADISTQVKPEILIKFHEFLREIGFEGTRIDTIPAAIQFMKEYFNRFETIILLLTALEQNIYSLSVAWIKAYHENVEFIPTPVANNVAEYLKANAKRGAPVRPSILKRDGD